jgi:hypothetical protein
MNKLSDRWKLLFWQMFAWFSALGLNAVLIVNGQDVFRSSAYSMASFLFAYFVMSVWSKFRELNKSQNEFNDFDDERYV